ncbi:hypothetical protein C0Q70_04194 [Pomacea canaliculata]|uniref:Uncharacterized protein n=1 Tax=Pomacea canaliculata TaxID=400727 RepID=A0A2T7PUW1_POMCA|nr:hypothetical protein C0Q70_04194 [Pomacea canaliculata]
MESQQQSSNSPLTFICEICEVTAEGIDSTLVAGWALKDSAGVFCTLSRCTSCTENRRERTRPRHKAHVATVADMRRTEKLIQARPVLRDPRQHVPCVRPTPLHCAHARGQRVQPCLRPRLTSGQGYQDDAQENVWHCGAQEVTTMTRATLNSAGPTPIRLPPPCFSPLFSSKNFKGKFDTRHE